MLVCFDATVLCGAIRKPTGYNFKLLELAAGGAVLSGFTTDVAGMEFVRNALDGLSGVTYDMGLIEAFLDHFAPLFSSGCHRPRIRSYPSGSPVSMRGQTCLPDLKRRCAFSANAIQPLPSRLRSHRLLALPAVRVRAAVA